MAQTTTPFNWMPAPAEVKLGNGNLVIDSSFTVSITGPSDIHLRRSVASFLERLRKQTGMPPQVFKLVDDSGATLAIQIDHATPEILELGVDESYSLEVKPSGANLNADSSLGAMRGLQTLLQMVQTGPDGFAVPCVSIHDHPRFPWRGLMIDVSRHFMPIEVLKRNLDGMAAVKLNVFHWHLSDDQGFRVESKKFPRLQELGSDGLFYTQAQVREIIAYARDRGIRVVPEFDMPGHSTSWFAGYPEIASGPGPYQVERRWGVFDPAMDPTQDGTYKFLDEFIGEMAALFPDRYFHIGGDEVNGKQWAANPKIQEFMRAHALKDKQDLQMYFNGRVQKIVSKHGKTMMGWDEILRPDLPKDIVIQSWRGQASLAAAATQGYRGLLSFGYYLDLNWPASRHYLVDPMGDAAATLPPALTDRILGGEACMWAEYVSPENIDSRIWPRAAAIAERLWSAQNVVDVNSMYQRLGATSDWLNELGLTHNSSYEPMLRRIAGDGDPLNLRNLADLVEPVKDYDREEQATTPATSLTPLNRAVDTARPESEKARRFSDLVEILISGKGDDVARAELRATMIAWKEHPLSASGDSFLVKEVLPLAEDLSALADAGLQALDYLQRGAIPPSDWKTRQLARIDDAMKPKAQLLLMVAPPVRKLVEYSSATPIK